MTKYSQFGDQFDSDSGTRQLMDDLGEVLNSGRAIMNLGGGNPGTIPRIRQLFHEQMQATLDDGRFDAIAGQYDGPQGHRPFLDALAGLLRRRFGWDVDASNIATTAGSQASFFILFNMFAGMTRQGHARHILFPLTPEYIGYADVGLQANSVRSVRPSIEIIDEHTFKYRIDFGALDITPDVAAVCVSRPTNPTGNVVTDDELGRLVALTREYNVPLIIDNAYGLPFPNIVFSEVSPVFDKHTILCMSLSKLGLPGLRTGIIVAAPEIIQTITSVNAITMLANGSLGASLVTELINSGQIESLCEKEIKPFYLEKALQARAWCSEYFTGINYYLHKTEGAIFLWAWFPDLPISDIELYERLKRRDVLVLAGRHFFPGLGQHWEHTEQCLRISYAQDPESVRRGIEIIGEELRRAFDK
ncbi:MAG: valine--pyruvate transaminase [Proteobacteria bacterium]|nr:valine--pyruvate transaminase [Pseudomonadota bacterium]